LKIEFAYLTYSFDLTIEERETLLSLGILTALKNGLEEGKKYVGNIDINNIQDSTI
jgi:hypothetical protein